MAAELKIAVVHGSLLRAEPDIEHTGHPDLLIVTGDLAEAGLPDEFRAATQSLARLAESLGVPRRHVAIVPGRGDVNLMACQAHFLQQGSRGQAPVPPYFPKWQQYVDALSEFYADVPGVTFTPDEPWTLFELPDLRVVVAGLNSTMALSHRPGDDYGLLTGGQLDWFAGQLARYPGWLRVAAVSHANARDAAALNHALMAPGLASLRIDGERTAADGIELMTARIPASAGVSAARDTYLAYRDVNIYPEREAEPDRSESFLGRVAEVARLKFPQSIVSERVLGGSCYLRVSVTPENGVAEAYPVGVTDGPASREALDGFIASVHSKFAAADHGVRSELIYAGSPAPAELVLQARRQGVRLRSFIDYQGLLDLRPLAARQREALAADRLYPAELYVDQRFTITGHPGEPVPPPRTGLLTQATDWLSSESARLIVVLGDFGRGKTSFLRQLTRHLPAELPSLTPVLVELRYLEKGPTLDDLLAQHLVRQGVDDVGKDKLHYMIRSGRVALLFDGFDELELRVGYDSAADYLQTLLNSLTGQAKVVLTSRTQHFRSVSQVHAAVRTALGERVETQAGSRVAILEDFTEAQIQQFLTNLYGGDATRAQHRFELIGDIAGLLELTRNPRMLAFVAQLPDERLLAVRSSDGSLTAAGLYSEIIDFWLANEEQRQRHSRGLAALTKDERFQVCTSLALRMWRENQPSVSLGVLADQVVATLTRLVERGFSDDQAVHSIASGSLLVRPNDDEFTFVHQSVMEWLVAASGARQLRDSGTARALHAREMSRLMSAFFADLAGHALAGAWASGVLADQGAPEIARRNALAVNSRLPRPPEPTRQDLSGLDLRATDLTGWDLRGASLCGASLRGMRLGDVSLEDTDLSGADLTGVVLMGGSLRGALLAGSTWHRAALLGTSLDDPAIELAAAAVIGRDRAEAVLEAPSSSARCITFSPDGGLIVYGAGTMLKIADSATGRTLRILRGHQATVRGAAFSPDGRHLATASADSTVRTWEATTGQPVTTFTGHNGPVNAVAYSPDGRHIATASSDRTVGIWDATTGQSVTTLNGQDGAVYAVAYSPDGTRIATASDDKTAKVWDATSGQLVTTITGHDGPIIGVAFSPDGRHLASASADCTARTWDATTGRLITTLTGHDGYVDAAAYSPDGSHIATAGTDRSARIWDATTGQPVTTLTGHTAHVNVVAYSPDGIHIASASSDRTAQTWNAATGRPIATLAGHTDLVSAIAFSPEGTRIVTAGMDRSARIWDTGTGQPLTTLTGHNGAVNAVAYSPDGTHIATASSDRTTRTWDATTGRPAATFSGHTGYVNAVAYSPDGTHIATGSNDFSVRTWNATTGQLTATLSGHTGYVNAVTYSPDGTHIATASYDCTARVWDVASVPGASRLGRLLQWRPTVTQSLTLRGHDAAVNAVLFHPNEKWVLTGSSDRTIRVWRLSDGTTEHVLSGHDGLVTSLRLSSDGRFLISGSTDGAIRIWVMATLELAATLITLPEGGYATLLPNGSYKLEGDPGDRLWWVMKLCRFGPGELDPYVPEIRRLPADAPILPQA